MAIFTGSSREQPTSNIKSRKAKWTGQTLRRNCLLRRVIEGNIERWREKKGRRGKRRKQLKDELKEKNK